VIGKALQKNRTHRFQTAKELMNDLKSATAPAAELPRQEKSLMVLPFEDLSPHRDQEYFSDGLTEEIISDLYPSRAMFPRRRAPSSIWALAKRTPRSPGWNKPARREIPIVAG
jgi:hypothetical protein